jgi:kynurenine formamidase
MALSDALQDLAQRVSNWGRWGAGDQRGTLNFISPDATRRGAACVRRGVSFSLAIPFDADGPQTGSIPGRINPQRRVLTFNTSYTGDPSDFTTTDDAFEMGTQAATHWDALAHAGYDGLLYNGIADSANTEAGASKLGIEHFGPIVTRGLLLDIARLHGVDALAPGTPIGAADLDAAASRANVAVESGDIVLVRTGHMHLLRTGDKASFVGNAPGLGVGSIQWLHDNEVAAVATDTLALEVWPPEDPKSMLPVHMLNLRDQGLVQGQLWYLDALAGDCASDGVSEFLLVASPLPLTGAVGGPVVPTATK